MSPESSPTGRDFMRAICERPDDDAPRLIFADWLREQGEDERAEYIRLAIEYDRGRSLTPEMEAIYDTINQKYYKHCHHTLATSYSSTISRIELTRGFLSSISLPASAYKQHARRIIEKHLQPITEWKITDVEVYQYAEKSWSIRTTDYAARFSNGASDLPFVVRPSFGQWPDRETAKREFNRMLVEWANGNDSTS